ncbi:DUF3019 domain-containing protein [Thalassotalea marina]|uniref:DUF3019 domain-containing protein n=1 Tax=Thalassotalea marina TaxID=1673741 RepID=A0A919EGY3_9GAMM|nr:DUF3019 domain-containing protein [Thalassotalea marina]GHF81590.1 hypothetical protein GCM10017161_06290 [Thalassotalea marina]
MRFKGLKLCIAWLLFLPLSTFANSLTTESSDSAVNFNIKPLACIVAQPGQPCQMTITAQWQTPTPISACLLQDQVQLACWQQTTQVKQRFNISLTTDMVFTLNNASGQLIAQQKIKVNAAQSTKYRRRLRSQWSLF